MAVSTIFLAVIVLFLVLFTLSALALQFVAAVAVIVAVVTLFLALVVIVIVVLLHSPPLHFRLLQQSLVLLQLSPLFLHFLILTCAITPRVPPFATSPPLIPVASNLIASRRDAPSNNRVHRSNCRASIVSPPLRTTRAGRSVLPHVHAPRRRASSLLVAPQPGDGLRGRTATVRLGFRLWRCQQPKRARSGLYAG